MKSIRSGRHQYGVIPFRLNSKGKPEVALITSRDTGRWVIPKGWPMLGQPPHEAALIEAYEEAGLQGRIVDPRSIGSYPNRRRLPNGQTKELTVRVYLMQVAEALTDWPERRERTLAWFKPVEAAAAVNEIALQRVIRRLPRLVKKSGCNELAGGKRAAVDPARKPTGGNQSR